jgi:hypothetical protein
MKKLVLAIVATVMFGFVGSAQNLRSDFLKGKTHKQAVEAYNKLSEQDQINLWIEKTEQLLTSSLPADHLKLIAGIKEGLVNKNGKSLKENSVALAKITPLKDFGLMFERFEDYKFSGKFVDVKPVPEDIIVSISESIVFEPENLDAQKACTCSWCAGSDNNGGKLCQPTRSGCGFMWEYPCDRCMICY